MTATILATARAAGETAPVLLTMNVYGQTYQLNPLHAMPTIPMEIWTLLNSGQTTAVAQEQYATAPHNSTFRELSQKSGSCRAVEADAVWQSVQHRGAGRVVLGSCWNWRETDRAGQREAAA